MSTLEWKCSGSPAEVLQALSAHRLLPVSDLLSDRGLLRPDLVPMANRLGQKQFVDLPRRAQIENEVCTSLADAGVTFLVLKGALLSRTVYPPPERRVRTDMDLLVSSEEIDQASLILRQVGFRPSHEVHGGPPMTQAQWIRPGRPPSHAVDLHWDLFNLPLLKTKFPFDDLLDRAHQVPGLPRGASGLSAPDALVHACTHYFGHHQGEFRPDQWLLDMDLLWRAMTPDERERTLALACSAGVASLVAEGLALASKRFLTPLDDAMLKTLRDSGQQEKSRRLLNPAGNRAVEGVRSGLEETGFRNKLVHLWRLAFPPAAYMQRKYSDSSRWALPLLYVRRAVAGLRKKK